MHQSKGIRKIRKGTQLMEEKMKRFQPRIQEIKELDAEILRLQERRVKLISMMSKEDQEKYKALYPPKFVR